MAKRLAIYTLCWLLALLPASPVLAVSGEKVIEGNATFTRPDDQTTIIDTTTTTTIVEYDDFDIDAGDLVKINQPTDTSKILNHVPFGDPTRINGTLLSNGFVYVVNPAGVFVGDEALIDVGGLVAAAGRISYDDFMRGYDAFTELGGDVVIAEGAMVRADDSIALLGQRVANYGTVISQGGMIAFVAGEEAVIASLDGHVSVRVDGGDTDPLDGNQFALTQGGTVDAGGGRVLLTAGDTYSLALNHDGITRGRDIQLEVAGEGLVHVAGTLDASDTSDGATGGSIEVLGDRIAVTNARLDVSGDAGGGRIRIGGDVQGGGHLRTARRTWVSDTAELVADAITDGDGGSIVVWSDERTGFFGSATARGGLLGGDGGFVEISGKQSLQASGHLVDLSAPNGRVGTLLYDPEHIQIFAGSPGTPASSDGDGDDNLLQGGSGGVFANDDPSPFVIYESEIEGTNANIILQATSLIEVMDDRLAFSDESVRIMDGNSLLIQVVGNPNPDIVDDGLAIDLGNVDWIVSGGGLIDIRTIAGTPGDADSPVADIEVLGSLIFESREFTDGTETGGLLFPLAVDISNEVFQVIGGLPATDVGVNVQADVGSIVVGSIITSGQDASAGGTMFASSGAGVRVTSLSGDVTITGTIDTSGGNAIDTGDPNDLSPADGGFGGDVTLETNDGTLWVQGTIDASGGDGVAGAIPVTDEDDDFIVAGNGGEGGEIQIGVLTGMGDAPTGNVLIMADLATNPTAPPPMLISNGGRGQGEIGVAIDNGPPVTVSGRGGESGRIAISADGGVTVTGIGTGQDEQVVIQANGGDGRGGGGATGGDGGVATISITVPTVDTTPDGGIDLVMSDVVIESNGGSVDGTGPSSAGSGGTGGVGGAILIDAGEGELLAGTNVRVEANGGDGLGGALPDGSIAALIDGDGGAARSVIVGGDAGVEFGDVVAQGGDGVNGAGGQGGQVAIDSLVGSVDAGAIDVSGGSAIETRDELEGVAGGAGGSIFISTGSDLIDDSDVPPPPGLEVTLHGDLVGLGGSGSDDEGDVTYAAGALLNIESDTAIEADSGVVLRGGQVNLESPTIGALGAIDIAGTAADDDRAFLSTDGSMQVNVLFDSQLEEVLVQHTDEAATSTISADDDMGVASPILIVDAATAGTPQTISHMVTADTDPALGFLLDARSSTDSDPAPDLVVAADAVHLGTAGGSITNDDGGLLAGAGAGGSIAHIESTGNVLLSAVEFGGSEGPLRVDGDTDASLQILARGDVAVEVANLDAGGAFGAIDVTQNVEGASTVIFGTNAAGGPFAELLLLVLEISGPDEDISTSLLTGSTIVSQSDLAYRQVSSGTFAGPPDLLVQNLDLGGDGTISVTGNLGLLLDAVDPSDPTPPPSGPAVHLATAGTDLLLDAGGDIVAEGTGPSIVMDDTGGDPTDLVLSAGGLVLGDSGDGALLTSGVDRLAVSTGDEARIVNTSTDGDGLEIAQIEVLDPTDRSGDTVQFTFTGIRTGGDFELDNGDQRIVLGDVEAVDQINAPTQISVDGNVVLHSDVEVANAQYIEVPTVEDDGSLGSELVAVNAARVAASGDITFMGKLDTSDEVAVDDITDAMEDTPEPDVFVASTLVVDADGTATYGGDIGTRAIGAAALDQGGAFALLDTTDARLDDGVDGPVPADLAIHAGEVLFRGALDGPDGATIVGEVGALPDDVDETRVSFGGNIGQLSAVGGLDVQADQIRFDAIGGGSAELVTIAGDLDLSTGVAPGEVPAVATITDTGGNLSITTSGDVTLGSLEKFTAVGELAINAGGTVTVGDLTASRIEIQSSDIQVMARDAALVQQADGSTVMDNGVDWVANEIITSSPLQTVGSGVVELYVGSGGIVVPGGLGGYRVRYASADLGSINTAALIADDGTVLDLTGNGPPLVADPTRAIPRIPVAQLPDVPPEFGSEDPATAAKVSAEQVLAFLRCSGFGATGSGGRCGDRELATLAAVERFDDTALATDRAREVTARYRDLVAAEGSAQRLRAAFASAGRAFGETLEWRDGTLDGGEFYRFLASAPREQAAALASVRELAWLFVQLDLLGLTDGDTRRLQQTLAGEFASAAGLQGFDAQAVTAAVEESPVGWVEPDAR